MIRKLRLKARYRGRKYKKIIPNNNNRLVMKKYKQSQIKRRFKMKNLREKGQNKE